MDFLLELVANPKCFIRANFPSTFTNSCWFWFGWGFCFLIFFFWSSLAFWGILGNGRGGWVILVLVEFILGVLWICWLGGESLLLFLLGVCLHFGGFVFMGVF